MRAHLLVVTLAASSVALAQSSSFHHHNVDFGIGPAIPTGNTGAYLNNAPIIAFHYGYRFYKILQADAGFQLAWGAAGGSQNAVLTNLGPVQGGDHEWMFPLGGRIIIPIPLQKIEISAGGGGIHLHYSETAPSGGGYYGYGTTCYSCTSRGGWGGYGLANVSYFLDENHTFRVETTAQYISAATNGNPVGNVPGIHTTDHWLNLTFGIGLSF